ncbi:TetR/AcrR family transcriptional regulator [Streptomyces sp. HUAS TT20]|uniref:TetR/AcrR family transcriptional regulator n=1 Tax=Streptomyces sp. HUAS TT20 TaxID=3447509 RepID=UPI0021D8DA4D|nr:TetR/AcrR family transcriptional regulator [Streptomyces sp. HUAS 15-9]UXY26165.1 TetR/AcrR family transcriptional regulator [Streptomyces sp. HUAS 15-9]
MARVSQAHLDARRRQILDGAARCFARNGFHATSMQDVLKETDLSAGAVYRYFSGKDELIGAIVGEVLDVLRETYEGAAVETPPPLPDVLIPRALRQLREVRPGLLESGEWLFPRLMIQAWTEILRNAELARIVRAGYDRVRAAWVRVVESYKSAGLISADADADAMARVMIALAQGYAAQLAVIGDLPSGTLADGLRALMSMRDPRSTV